MKLDDKEIFAFQEKMLGWFRENYRSFPWRETTEPYAILVSEFLLQKTHVRKVVEIYPLVIKKYPTLQYLAEGEIQDLEKIIQPLGFLYRAERMIKMAKYFVKEKEGIIPDNFDSLVAIKGIGWYIATALLVFAFEQKRVIVDTNVIKVIKLEFGYISDNPRPRTDKALWKFCQDLAPDNHIREFNWALLDYGADVMQL